MPYSPEDIEKNKEHLSQVLTSRLDDLDGEDLNSEIVIEVTESMGHSHENDDHTSFVPVEKWRGTVKEALEILDRVREKIEKGEALSEEEHYVLFGSNVF